MGFGSAACAEASKQQGLPNSSDMVHRKSQDPDESSASGVGFIIEMWPHKHLQAVAKGIGKL